MSAGIAPPIDAAIKRFGSFVEFLAITVKVICPGFNSFNPSSLLIRLQPGGNMLLTVTRLQISMPAFRKAASKELR